MKDLREIIAKNICELRLGAGMTQQDLARIFNYSDKAVSKWERGEALPDVTVLKRIADHFCVTVDYLLEEKHTSAAENPKEQRKLRRRKRFAITLISFAAVWFVATVVFAVMLILDTAVPPAWLMYIYAIPLSFIVLIVFNSIWGNWRFNILISSVILWGVILTAYLTVLTAGGTSLWVLFIIGIPCQLIFLFLPGTGIIAYRPYKTKKGECDKDASATSASETAN